MCGHNNHISGSVPVHNSHYSYAASAYYCLVSMVIISVFPTVVTTTMAPTPLPEVVRENAVVVSLGGFNVNTVTI